MARPMADIPAPVKREPLSKFDFASLFLAQGGRCAVCGCKLERGKVRDEHLHALNLGGGNELTNRALWCLDCTKPKDKSDKGRIAKVKRLNGTTSSQASRRAERGPQIVSRGFGKLPEGRDPKTWQSAGFRRDAKMKRTVSGKVIPR